jgi:hypothetical protein
VRLLLLALLAAPLVACDTGLDASPAPPPDASATCVEARGHSDFTWIRENVLRGCALASSCHGGRTAGGLDLRANAAYAALVDQPAEGNPDQVRVAPFAPGASYLIAVLSTNTPIARRMPPAGALCRDQIEAIDRWIALGAPND